MSWPWNTALLIKDQHISIAAQRAVGQLSAIIALLHDLTEPEGVQELAVEAVSYPQLQLPPEANCTRYDQLLRTGEAA